MHVEHIEASTSRWCGVEVKRCGVPAQVSSSSIDLGSKFRDQSPKALDQLNSAKLIFTHSDPKVVGASFR
ncbi:hypothetical protein TNCV_892851 [Trichonephila clavipes]|nr:hypothetical protein TNCV_892851 [Trichonephila clavipes]